MATQVGTAPVNLPEATASKVVPPEPTLDDLISAFKDIADPLIHPASPHDAAPPPASPAGALATLPPHQAGPASWYGPEMVTAMNKWRIPLADADIADLERAADAWLSAHPEISTGDIAVADPAKFPLPTLAPKLIALVPELQHGRGFFVLTGLPVERLSERTLAVIFSGMGAHMGALRPQDAQGRLVGHIRDQGLVSADPNVRIYQTSERQGFHADWADIVALLCIRPAVRGGTSMLVSSHTIFNEMRRQRPDLLELLMQPIATDRRGEVSAGEKPYDLVPVFSWHDGYLTTLIHRVYIESAQRFPDAPRLTERHREALDMFEALANSPDISFAMRLAPGDMQFVYNHSMLHDRTAYDDSSVDEEKRHLLRIWVAPADDRPLPPAYVSRYGSLEAGKRGGVIVR